MSMKTVASAISAILALNLSGTQSSFAASTHDHAAAADVEKCYGVAKAGRNDCGTALHGCAGLAKTDGERAEWVAAPKGLCEKIVGGTTKPPEKT